MLTEKDSIYVCLFLAASFSTSRLRNSACLDDNFCFFVTRSSRLISLLSDFCYCQFGIIRMTTKYARSMEVEPTLNFCAVLGNSNYDLLKGVREER